MDRLYIHFLMRRGPRGAEGTKHWMSAWSDSRIFGAIIINQSSTIFPRSPRQMGVFDTSIPLVLLRDLGQLNIKIRLDDEILI